MSPEDLKRLRELAWWEAIRLHQASPDEVHAGLFRDCPHPDCVLVRASAPSVVEPAKEPWQSDDLHGFGNAAEPAKRLHAADCQSLDYDRCSCTCGAVAPSAVEAKEPQ